MASTLGRVVNFPIRETASRAGAAVIRLTEEQVGVVDDWGRDPGLVRGCMNVARLRWQVAVGGDRHLPRRKGALIVVNTRRFALSPIFAAFAISEAVDRPVRFVGRPDTAPVGAFSRRIGGLLDHPDEVAGALAARELVVVGAEHDARPRRVGVVDHTIISAALATGVQVFPAATSSTPFGRTARVEVGQASSSSRRRRGPLAELELADRVRSDLVALLEGLGEIRTGTPLDWLPLSGIGGGA